MLDPKLIRDQFPLVLEGLSSRNPSWTPLLERYVEKDRTWRALLQEVDLLKAKRNQAPKGTPTPEQLIELKQLSETIKLKQTALGPLEEEVKQLALSLPNVPDASTPFGQDESQNIEIRRVGTPRQFDFTPLSHDELGKKIGILDFDSAVRVTGARFVVYRKWGARLTRALTQLMLDLHVMTHGYEEISPPFLVNTASLTTTGQLPKFADDAFQIADSDFWLSPTAEVQLTNLYRDQIIDESLLPLALSAYTPCFRREAGSYGRDMSGLIRHHQFDKVELVRLVKPEQSSQELETLLNHAEAVLKALQLPYRVMSLCRGDLGFSAAKTYDIEVWLPSPNKYREISSCSNFFDFQSRRGMIRYRASDTNEVAYVHTLNGSGLAVGRTLAAILENYQTAEGKMIVPEALRPYLGVDEIS